MNTVRTIMCCITLGLCLASPSAWATKAYVTDFFNITLRTGPSVQNKIIALLNSGQPLDVLDSVEDWTQVRIVKRNGAVMEGWVLSRYVIKRVPWESQADYFKKQNASLKKKLALCDTERGEASSRSNKLTAQLKENTKSLHSMQKKHETLKHEAATYLELKATYEKTHAALEVSQDTAKRLTLENEKLKATRRNTWFASGALVLLCGLIIGLVIGKREKKRKTMLYP